MFRSAAVVAVWLAFSAVATADSPELPGSSGASFDQLATAQLEVIPNRVRRGETVTVRVTVTPKAGAWTYPAKPKDESQASKTRFSFRRNDDLILVGPVSDPAGLKEKLRDEKQVDGPKDQYYPGPAAVVWELKAVVNRAAAPGAQTVGLSTIGTQLQVCNKSACYPAENLPAASFVILPDPPIDYEEAYRDEVKTKLNPPAPPAPPMIPGGTRGEGGSKSLGDSPRKIAKPTDTYQTELNAIGSQLDKTAVPGIGGDQKTGLWGFVATAALWGLISLVTPCVFPMIPITVSIFMKQAHGSLKERLKLAGVYCLTIIAVLGVSAFALLKFMAWLSANPITNLLLAMLFIVLALSLFGMYELTLPNFMVRRLQAKQAKGGVVGTIFGALAFTVISFTCVAPFLGGFAGISAADTGGSLIAVPTARELLGGLAFATAFAAPFFVLALVPGLLKSLPKSGGWLDSVKVVMGFLELAAALKFLRTAELRIFSPPDYFTYDLVLGAWIAISVACGLYLLNVFRLPHDEERPNIGVPRLLFALLFLGFAVYLTPAVFKGADGKSQRPAGAVYAWVDAFLLPEPGRDADLPWSSDLSDATARARSERKPIFVDFTGVTCTNCKYNENNVFPLPRVREQLEKFERVQLYTDEVPASIYAAAPDLESRELEARANREFKIKAFGTDQLPLYVVLLPDATGTGVRVLAVYPEGKINDPDRFVKFLQTTLDDAKK